MRKIILALLSTGVIQSELLSQDLPSIQTDRPDQTESSFNVPKNHFQIEAGFVYEKDETIIKNIPSTLLKFGLSDRFELRLILDVIKVNNNGQNGKNEPGLSPVEVGFKVNVSKEHGIIPTTALIGHLMIPKLASDQNAVSYYAPNFRFCMQHTLSDKMSLAYNLGAEWDGLSAEPTFIYTLTTGVSITNKMGGYVELYGFAPQKSKADHRFDGGLTYLVKKNFQLDVSAGVGLTDNAPDHFYGLGLSVRFPN